MFSQLLDPKVQQFIKDTTGSPVDKLALQKNPFPQLQWADVLNQISARAKAKDKLPTWFEAECIIYPSKISVEQTSSEAAAEYKAGLVSGESLIDLTGGFGIDDYYFSKTVGHVTHCELNLELSAIAKHNFEVLGADTIQCLPGDSLDILNLLDRQWEWLYIDPSRRSDAKGKVFLLKDCLPNVPALLDTYFKYTNNILIKTAPLLDISAGLGELHPVKSIHIVAVNNEVKELLWVLQKGYYGPPMLYAVDLGKSDRDVFESVYDNTDEAFYELPQKYLYEPNSAIMKSGAFDSVSRHYNIAKLHRHTQLYTSDELIDFPGRRFAITEIIPFQKAAMKQLEGKKMNITVRNFPISVEELRKKWKLKDGGEAYAFFTTTKKEEKAVLLCSKI
ncbi:class I SAM-dependent methyltransferase [Flavobacterium sp. MFBS3-15]|uniref:class I SAM-dependent methyltransferase n=1 Tax=Flavobacterium sp. MFBS3-15 TaxID=2989816 RepID=UPI0022361FA1|nr:class I SAM-dependent methyltransferase [Flavobacterium sp. MFBS3-15]MCW4470251.1 class I SAM-dependent methyltransferase [Flavobacterium sp. MFBS3-15]